MSRTKKLVGERCYLSPCLPEDAALWARWLNDLHVAVPLGDEAYTQPTLDQQEGMIASIGQAGFHAFTIVALADDVPVGRCLLFDIDPVDRRAMLGVFIGERAYWGQGYGRDAVRLLLDYGFGLLNLNSVMLGVMAFNQRAIRCYEAVGFREIGRRRQARIIAGEKHDVVLMDILAEEFGSPYVRPLMESLREGASHASCVEGSPSVRRAQARPGQDTCSPPRRLA